MNNFTIPVIIKDCSTNEPTTEKGVVDIKSVMEWLHGENKDLTIKKPNTDQDIPKVTDLDSVMAWVNKKPNEKDEVEEE